MSTRRIASIAAGAVTLATALAARPVAAETAAPAIAPQLIELDARLRRRRIADLRALVDDEGEPERARVSMMLAETLIEHARALRLDIVPDAPTDPAERDAVERGLYVDARRLLQLAYRGAERAEVRDRAGLLWADLLVLEGAEREAQALLAEIEATSTTSLARARAAEHQARLLEGDIDLDAQRKALAAYERALAQRPTVSNRRGAAQAAEQVGDVERALRHYRVLLGTPGGPSDIEAVDARRFAARSVGLLVSRWTPLGRAIEYIEALGSDGVPVWRFAGEALLARQEHAAARQLLARAVAFETAPEPRLLALAGLIDAGLHLEDRAQVMAAVAPLSDALVEAGAALPRRTAEHVERALRLVVRQIHADPFEAWTPEAVGRVIGLYAERFPTSPDLPLVRYVGGRRRAQVAETCDARIAAAEEMWQAFDHAMARERGVALEAGTAAVLTLAECRVGEDGADGRAPSSPVDAEIVTLAERVLAAEPSPEARGALQVALGRAQQALGADDDARAAFQRALEFEGHHLAAAALYVLDAWAMKRAWLEVEARARHLAADERLDPAFRALVAARAADAALLYAAEVDGAERAQRLVRFADGHPDDPRVVGALVEAGTRLRGAGRGAEASALLGRAVDVERGRDRPGSAHLALGALHDARGEFGDAAPLYLAVARAAVEGRSDVAVEEAERLRMRAALRWRRLGEWERAAAVEPDPQADGGPLATAVARLAAGDLDAARALADVVEWRDAASAGVVGIILGCTPENVDGLLAAHNAHAAPGDRATAALAACVALRAEAMVEAGLSAEPGEQVEALVARIVQVEGWTMALRALRAPIAASRCYVAIALLRLDLSRALLSVGGEAADALAEKAAAQQALAWRFWQMSERQSRSFGYDLALSRRLGAALRALVDAPIAATVTASRSGEAR